ncbi:MAG: DNA-binding protein [Bacteroidetes bacterium]|nr:MAG: DNA-binding protein [Bacteroidota bacterium]TNE98650.1 MAG: DNA-binding protein [Bacteroidota bacterium]
MHRINERKFDENLKDWIDYLQYPNEIPKPKDLWLNVEETCALLRFSEVTFYRKCKSGQLNSSKPSGIMIWISDAAKYVLKDLHKSSSI